MWFVTVSSFELVSNSRSHLTTVKEDLAKEEEKALKEDAYRQVRSEEFRSMQKKLRHARGYVRRTHCASRVLQPKPHVCG